MCIENLYACMCAISKSYVIKKALHKSISTAPTIFLFLMTFSSFQLF